MLLIFEFHFPLDLIVKRSKEIKERIKEGGFLQRNYSRVKKI